MTFIDHSGALRCKDCLAEITLREYRRKVPRCDECHADEEVRALRAALDGFAGAA
jgi:hypothetical protein